MKNNFFTFTIINCKKNETKSIIKSLIDDLFAEFKIKFSIEDKENLLLLMEEDLNEDIKESFKSLVQDFEGDIKVFEGFRLYNKNDLYKLNQYYEKYCYKSYMNITDLILKMNNDEIKDARKIVLKEINNNNYMIQIINGMFESNLNVSKTASIVFMHRNSITKKLSLIEKETGLDIQKFSNAVAMYNLIKK